MMHRTIRTLMWRRLGVCVLALTASGISGVAMAQDDAPVTLRLAVSDTTDRPSYPVVTTFVEAVSTLSGGAITIEPIFDAAGPAFEEGVARMLLDGEAELAVVASRAWDTVGVTSLQALQAPFVIDSDALAVAVAESDIAQDMLQAMSSHGVVGLAMWPEDLRHPVALGGCSEPLTSPDDFAGLTLRTTGSSVTSALFEMLGAIPASDYGDACEVQGGESGLRQGQSLPGGPRRPTFTGDVTLFSKYQVLVANAAAFERLSDAQRELVREAAALAQDRALTDRPTDAAAAVEWCADGGRVVLAGPEGVAAFVAAAQPLIDRLASDLVANAAISGIQALKESTLQTPGAEACEPVTEATGPTAVGAVSELPADGTWRIDVTREAMAAAGLSTEDIDNVSGLYTWTFRASPDAQGGTFTLGGQSPLWGSFDCEGEYGLREDGALHIRFLTGVSCGGAEVYWIWTDRGDGTASVRVLDTPGWDVAIDRAISESALYVRVD